MALAGLRQGDVRPARAVVHFRRDGRPREVQDSEGLFLYRLAALGRRIGTPGVLPAKLSEVFAPKAKKCKVLSDS